MSIKGAKIMIMVDPAAIQFTPNAYKILSGYQVFFLLISSYDDIN